MLKFKGNYKNGCVMLAAIFMMSAVLFPMSVTRAEELHGKTGFLPATAEELASIPRSPYSINANEMRSRSILPATVDLSDNCPVPLNQTYGNCVSVSVAYGMMTWQEQNIRGWGQHTKDHQFSPAFLFNQKNAGAVDAPMSFPNAFDIIRTKGICTIESMPENTGLTVKPNEAQLAEALNYKISSYHTIGYSPNFGSSLEPNSQFGPRANEWHQTAAEWKTHLAEGIPFVIGIPLYCDLFHAGGVRLDNIFDNTTALGNGCTSNNHGGHAMFVVGYDDNIDIADGTKGAFKVMNSWGIDRMEDGYNYISYKMVDESYGQAWEAYYAVSETPTDNTNLFVSTPAWSPYGTASNITVAVTSNTSWITSSDAWWLTVSNSFGTNNGSFGLSVQANTATSQRSGTITVTGGGVTRKIIVNQDRAIANISLTPPIFMDFAEITESKSLNVTSNSQWTVTSNAAWLTLSTDGGNGNGYVTLTALENPTNSQRDATITVAGYGVTRSISIRQAPSTSPIKLSTGTWSPFENASNTSVSVTASAAWTISSDSAWLTTNTNSGTNNGSFTIYAAANTSTSVRSGKINISSGGITKTVIVKQAGASNTITLDTTTWRPTASASNSTTINVTSNTAWTVSSNAAWLKASVSSGTNNGSFIISTATENPDTFERNGLITVTNGSLTRSVTVVQTGVAGVISVSTNTWNPTETASNTSIDISANTTWEISSNTSWLTTNPKRGSKDRSVTLSAQANTTNSPRTGTITIAGTVAGSGVVSRTITVTQSSVSNALTLDTEIWNPEATVSSTTVAVTSNVPWTVSSNAAWLTASPNSGTNNGSFTINTEANTSTSERNGTITVTGGGITKKISVTQAGAGDIIRFGDVNGDGEVTLEDFRLVSNSYHGLDGAVEAMAYPENAKRGVKITIADLLEILNLYLNS